MLQPPEAQLNGRPARLAPGARIRGDNNLLVVSGAIANQRLLVHYTLDTGGPVARRLGADADRAGPQPWPTHARAGPRLGLRPGAAVLEPAMSEATKKVFIRTFGCQMNEYDSDKMADVLRAAEGYEPTTDVEQADLILFNTCSVREKAQEKVFSDLGRVKHLKKKGVLIGVGGCVASQEGAAIIERAPYVDLVFGPQTLHRLPQMIAARTQRSAGRRSTSASPRSRSSTTCRRRASTAPAPSSRSWKAAPNTARYCVVPYTRGEEVSRPFDDVLTEVAGLAEQGVKEVTLLGQNVNAYRGTHGHSRPRSPTSPCCWSTWPRSPASSASATPPATRRNSRRG